MNWGSPSGEYDYINVRLVKTMDTPSDPFTLTPGNLSQQIISPLSPKGRICVTKANHCSLSRIVEKLETT